MKFGTSETHWARRCGDNGGRFRRGVRCIDDVARPEDVAAERERFAALKELLLSPQLGTAWPKVERGMLPQPFTGAYITYLCEGLAAYQKAHARLARDMGRSRDMSAQRTVTTRSVPISLVSSLRG
jgi:hypothetical protein